MRNLYTKINVIILLISLLVVSACISTEAIVLRNKKTGEIAVCGPFNKNGISGPTAAAIQESQCINDFHRQGYERESRQN